MIEVGYVTLVGLAAICISITLTDVGGHLLESHRTAQRISRMEANPSPVYDHYPNP